MTDDAAIQVGYVIAVNLVKTAIRLEVARVHPSSLAPARAGLPRTPLRRYNKGLRKGLSPEMPKEKIHPNYAAVRVLCACGNNFETRSTHKGDIHVEICSVCHPFFTGKQRLVDTAGRVERFRRKYAKAGEPAASK